MWSATLSFPSFVASSSSLSSYRNHRFSKTQAPLFNYPLASKIMVRNLPFSTSEDFLQKEFSAFGEIAEVKLIRDGPMKRSKDDNGRLIYIDITKPRKRNFQGLPRTSGPPEKQHVAEESADDEVADYWY